MVPKDAEKIAFRTPIRNFYYTVMPFSLKNVRSTYQHTMITIFHDMMHCEMEDFMENIVLKSRNYKDHIKVLGKVFERCRLFKLRMNPLKCAFRVSTGKFLGFLVHRRGKDVGKGHNNSNHEVIIHCQGVKEIFRHGLIYQKVHIRPSINTSTFAKLLKKA